MVPTQSSKDTIAAIITPPGEGGIAAIRLAGPNCKKIIKKHFKSSIKKNKSVTNRSFKPFLLQHGFFYDKSSLLVDEVMSVYMPHGKSYTGEEQIEIFCHGGRLVVRQILEELLNSGARSAEPGEFTKLAFLAGKMDLTQAEAVAGIISANTEYSHKVASEQLTGAYSELILSIRSDIITVFAEVEASIDFPDEEIEPATYNRLTESLGEVITSIERLLKTYNSGRIIKEGYKIAIAGRPNAGKSSLFNLLLQQQRALVTPTAGTTRDFLSEWIDVGGVAVNIIDTAGLRKRGNVIEKAGQEKTNKILKEADLVLWMFDLSHKNWAMNIKDDLANKAGLRLLPVGNKIDLIKKPIASKQLVEQINDIKDTQDVVIEQTTLVSCKTKKGFVDLKKSISKEMMLRIPDLTSGLVVTSARHQQKLKGSLKHLKTAKKQLSISDSPELITFTLNQAINEIDEITGKIYNEDILGKIFSTFCLGK